MLDTTVDDRGKGFVCECVRVRACGQSKWVSNPGLKPGCCNLKKTNTTNHHALRKCTGHLTQRKILSIHVKCYKDLKKTRLLWNLVLNSTPLAEGGESCGQYICKKTKRKKSYIKSTFIFVNKTKQTRTKGSFQRYGKDMQRPPTYTEASVSCFLVGDPDTKGCREAMRFFFSRKHFYGWKWGDSPQRGNPFRVGEPLLWLNRWQRRKNEKDGTRNNMRASSFEPRCNHRTSKKQIHK